MFVYSIAIDRNARLEYDDDGITMYTVWGKPILREGNGISSPVQALHRSCRVPGLRKLQTQNQEQLKLRPMGLRRCRSSPIGRTLSNATKNEKTP